MNESLEQARILLLRNGAAAPPLPTPFDFLCGRDHGQKIPTQSWRTSIKRSRSDSKRGSIRLDPKPFTRLWANFQPFIYKGLQRSKCGYLWRRHSGTSLVLPILAVTVLAPLFLALLAVNPSGPTPIAPSP
ncbi:hypothetical protein ACFL02_04110 [Planctomycetota bacterium]